MNPIESVQLQINEVLGQLIHFGSSTSSTIADGLGMFKKLEKEAPCGRVPLFCCLFFTGAVTGRAPT